MSLHIHNPHSHAGAPAPGITVIPPFLADAPLPSLDVVTKQLGILMAATGSIISHLNDIELSAEARDKSFVQLITTLMTSVAAPAPASVAAIVDTKPEETIWHDLYHRKLSQLESLTAQYNALRLAFDIKAEELATYKISIWFRFGRLLGLI